MSVMACPHCDRMFLARPDIVGRKIRCRGCRNAFRIPDADEPAAPAQPLAGGHWPAPPIALERVIDGRDVRSCPTCGHTFGMQSEYEGKSIRCRSCRSTFRVATLAKRQPQAGGDSRQQPGDSPQPRPWSPPPAPRPSASPGPRPTVFEDIGDFVDELAAGEPCPPAENRPHVAAPRPASESVAQVIAVVLGGLTALPITQLLLWWVFLQDPLRLAPALPPSWQWLAPAELRLPAAPAPEDAP